MRGYKNWASVQTPHWSSLRERQAIYIERGPKPFIQTGPPLHSYWVHPSTCISVGLKKLIMKTPVISPANPAQGVT